MTNKTTAKAAPKKDGATEGIHATGPAGKAARKAANDAMHPNDRTVPVWDRPDAKYSADDNSIDARMWRLKQDHIAMGSRK